MIDLRNLRNNPEGVIQAIERRGEDRGALAEDERPAHRRGVGAKLPSAPRRLGGAPNDPRGSGDHEPFAY